ncbi:ATP-binding protein [Streptomyces sp. NPDC054841]
MTTLYLCSNLDPLVGRAAERAAFGECVESLGQGAGAALLYGADAGVGKTALLRSCVADAVAAGCTVAWWSAQPFEGTTPPLHPFISVGNDASVPQEVADGLREVRLLLEERRAGAGDPGAVAVERLIRALTAQAVKGPFIVVVEDLHWADTHTLLLWHRLGRAARHVPLLLVGSYRPGSHVKELELLIADVRRSGAVVHQLGALSREEVSELAAQRLGGRPGPVLSELLDRASGNPLYATALVDLLRSQGQLVPSGEGGMDTRTEAVPAEFHGVLLSHLEYLKPSVLETLQVAAVLGGEFAAEHLAAVLDRSVMWVLQDLEEALSCGLLSAAGRRPEFRHPMIRQALYESIKLGDRRIRHLHVARVLAGLQAGLDLVAHHLVHAREDLDRWGEQWVRDSVIGLVDRVPEAAVTLLKRVSERTDPADPHHDVLRLRHGAALARVPLPRDEEAETVLRQVLEETGHADTAAEAALLLGNILMRTDRLDESYRVLHGHAQREDVSVQWRADLLSSICGVRLWQGRYEEALVEAQEAERLSRATHDSFAIAFARHEWAGAAAFLDRPEEALDLNTGALHILGPDMKDAHLRHVLYCFRTQLLAGLDRLEQAQEVIFAGLEQAEALGDYWLAEFARHAGPAQYVMGKWDDLIAGMERAGAEGAAARRPAVWQLLSDGLLALVAVHRDDEATAAACLEPHAGRVLDGALETSWGVSLVMARSAEAERRGDPRAALDELLALLATGHVEASDWPYRWLPDAVRLAVALEDPVAARTAADACRPLPAHAGLSPWKNASAHCESLISGDPEPLLAAADSYRTSGRPPQLGQVLEDAAVLLAASGDRSRAAEVAAEAAAVHKGLGASWDLRRLGERLGEHGVRLGARARGRAARSRVGPLNGTEMRIAGLVAEGLSNPDIAVVMRIPRRTAQTHISRILTKLGARSRAEIAHRIGALQHNQA